MKKDENKLPLTPSRLVLDELFFLCSRQNGCQNCSVLSRCRRIHDAYQKALLTEWEVSMSFLELRRKAGYVNSRKGRMVIIC